VKKFIDGFMYDTGKATKIATYKNYENDFDNVVEILYKKVPRMYLEAEYFIHGKGGARTEWSHTQNGSTSGSEGIKLLTDDGKSDDNVIEWLEKLEDGDKVIKAVKKMGWKKEGKDAPYVSPNPYYTAEGQRTGMYPEIYLD